MKRASTKTAESQTLIECQSDFDWSGQHDSGFKIARIAIEYAIKQSAASSANIEIKGSRGGLLLTARIY